MASTPPIDNDISLWLDPDGGIMLRAVSGHGDPVELGSTQARRLAEALIELADADDAEWEKPWSPG